jgi:hypothetical protein
MSEKNNTQRRGTNLTPKKPKNPSLGRRNGNQTTYHGNGNFLINIEPKGVRLFFKKFVHILNSGSKSYDKVIEKNNEKNEG